MRTNKTYTRKLAFGKLNQFTEIKYLNPSLLRDGATRSEAWFKAGNLSHEIITFYRKNDWLIKELYRIEIPAIFDHNEIYIWFNFTIQL